MSFETLELLSANALNLDKAKFLSYGKDLVLKFLPKFFIKQAADSVL